MEDRPVLSFDTETHRFRPGWMSPRVVCLSYAVGDRTGLLDREAGAKYLAGALEEAAAGNLTITNQAISYDVACLLDTNPELGPLFVKAYDALAIHDTKIRERLLDVASGGARPWRSLSLGALADQWLGRKLDKVTWRLGYDALEGVPIDQWEPGARDYAVDDSIAARDVYQKQEEAAQKIGYDWRAESGRQACYDLALRLCSSWGVRVDPVQVARLRESVQARMLPLFQALRDGGLISDKGSKSMKAIRERVVAVLGNEAPTTPQGKVSTGAEILERCGDPLLDALAEYNGLEKLSSTYLAKLEAAGAFPVHASYEVLGADSGRTSSHDPNIQNQPREPGIRECIVPREGCVFVACDYDSQELRTLAQAQITICGSSRLAEAYQRDPSFDPHLRFASKLLGISYEEAKQRKKAGDKEVKAFRQRAKAANFGFPGGMGAAKFVRYARGYGVELSIEDSNKLRDGWFDEQPEMRIYFSHVATLSDRGDAFVQLFSGRRRAGCGFCDGANTYFQGLAADASKLALWLVAKACYFTPTSPLYGARIVIFIHDEIVIEVREDRAHEAAIELDRLMVEAMSELTPDVPARASPAIMRRWSKEADAAFDKAGRLIPWEDREHG
jgi:DNA polymerase I